jgi:hypothetical protein
VSALVVFIPVLCRAMSDQHLDRVRTKAHMCSPGALADRQVALVTRLSGVVSMLEYHMGVARLELERKCWSRMCDRILDWLSIMAQWVLCWTWWTSRDLMSCSYDRVLR